MNYLTLFPSFTRNLPRFSALEEAVLSQADDLIAVVQSMNTAFSVSRAVGSSWTRWESPVRMACPGLPAGARGKAGAVSLGRGQ